MERPRLRLRITSAAEKQVRAGHPWIFADSIREQNRAGETGELAVIFDRSDRFLAAGLYDSASPIRVRVLQQGKPAAIDGKWFESRFASAMAIRQPLLTGETDGYRCVNGESDGLPGLVLDRYADTAVLKLYTGAWFPRISFLAALVKKQIPVERVVLRLSRNIQKQTDEFADGAILEGPTVAGPVTFLENGLRFEAEVLRGQKTGFFLDQRDNRARVEKLCEGRAVLNLFSFSGGFSLYAARGGAQTVTSLDISAFALASAERNFALNAGIPQLARCPHELLKADAFQWLSQNQRRFDLIVVDPPSMAPRAADRTEAMRAYRKLTRESIRSLRSRGCLVAASCSAHVSEEDFFDLVTAEAAASRRPFSVFDRTGQPLDHPATFKEGRYLKCIYFTFE